MPSPPKPPRRTKQGLLKSGADRDHRTHLGRRIKERRLSLGLSQEQVGQLLGRAASEVHRWERGERVVSTARLGDLSRALSVDPGYFFGDELAPPTERTHNEQEQLALALSRQFARINIRPMAEAVIHMVRAMAMLCEEVTELRNARQSC